MGAIDPATMVLEGEGMLPPITPNPKSRARVRPTKPSNAAIPQHQGAQQVDLVAGSLSGPSLWFGALVL
jgi:hypothetical protein